MSVAGFGTSLAFSVAERDRTNCETYAFNAERFRSSDEDTRRTEAYGISDCGLPGNHESKVGAQILPYEDR